MSRALDAKEPRAAGVLVVRSVPIADPGVPLVDLLPDAAGTVWSRHGDGMIGWGSVAQLRCSGPDRFRAARRWWRDVSGRAVVRDEVGARGSGLVAFGSFGFADDTEDESVLIVPSVVVGRRGNQWWVTTAGTDGDLPPLPPVLRRAEVDEPGRVDVSDGALTAPQWGAEVATAVDCIRNGPLEKVVLARDLEVHAERPIDARWPLRRLAARYPTCYTFAVDGLIGATPELLVRLDGRLVTSRVLAGTIRRTGADPAAALADTLASSAKDIEEHEHAVTSLATALGAHCTAMNVPEAPFVLELPNVLHLATDVTGVVDDDSTALDLVARVHPTAAVCGTPRELASAAIDEREQMDRGRYAGPVGWLSGSGDGEWGIALRSGRLDPHDRYRARIFAGCGIVADSDPTAEIAETDAKFVPMLDAFSVR